MPHLPAGQVLEGPPHRRAIHTERHHQSPGIALIMYSPLCVYICWCLFHVFFKSSIITGSQQFGEVQHLSIPSFQIQSDRKWASILADINSWLFNLFYTLPRQDVLSNIFRT